MRYNNTDLKNDALFGLKVLDSYERMLKEDGGVNVRKFCRIMGVSKPWFLQVEKKIQQKKPCIT